MTDAPEYLRAGEIARLFGVSLRTVRRWIAEEALPSVKLGGARLVPRKGVHGEFVITLRLASGTDRGNDTAKRSDQGRHGPAAGRDCGDSACPRSRDGSTHLACLAILLCCFDLLNTGALFGECFCADLANTGRAARDGNSLASHERSDRADRS